jgi:hypothetical protein
VKKQKTYNLEGYGFSIEKLANNVGTFVVASCSCIENKTHLEKETWLLVHKMKAYIQKET